LSSRRVGIFGAVGASFLVVAFSFVLLGRDPGVFWNDDYQTSILPVFADVARAWSEGHLPLLSPYSWVCNNLAGEFQYGTFSIFINAAIVLIWKFPLTFAQQAAAMSITHLVVLAAGGFVLAHDRKLSAPLSMMVALIAALNGWIICWGATDWFGALGAFAWLPWAWWGMERALDPLRTRWRFLWPAPFVYLLVTGGFPYTVLMLGVIALFLAVRAIVGQRNFFAAAPMILGVALGFGLGAPAWLALFDYVRGSARESQEAASHLQWRVPITAWPGLIWPGWTVKWADFSTRLMPHTAAELACGFLPVPALMIAAVRQRRALLKRTGWELALLLLVFILAMLPSASVFRWSFRWLPLFHLVLAICAAEAFAALKWKLFKRNAAWLAPAIVYLSLLATYLVIPPNCGVPRYNLSESLRSSAPLDQHRLYLSIYPSAELNYRMEKRPEPVGQLTRPGSTSMWAGLRFVNGYSPIRPAGVAREYHFSIHGELDPNYAWYLVEGQDAHGAELEILGVDGLVVAPEIGAAPISGDWVLVGAFNEASVYHRRGQPLATVRSLAHRASGDREVLPVATIEEIEESRNSVRADVTVPIGTRSSLIAFSRPYFPGYRATLDEHPIAVGSYNRMIPVVELPAGSKGRLELAYRPRWLTVGSTISSLCVVFLISCGGFAFWTKRRELPRNAV